MDGNTRDIGEGIWEIEWIIPLWILKYGDTNDANSSENGSSELAYGLKEHGDMAK
jgi:hypothetical protein